MPLLIPYLLKLSISLGVVWVFYQLVLRRLTFYNWNRLFLLGYSMLAFFIPFINISPVLEKSALSGNKIIQFVPPVVGNLRSIAQSFAMNIWDWTFIVFSIGCLILLARFVIQHISFLRLRRSAKLLLETPVKLYQVDKEIIPFSFGGSIFINANQHSEIDLKEIITHEFVHVKQKHSIDMLWAEWLCILNWFNPFAWLLRRSIRQNLEFIADNKVVQNGIDKKQYQYLLLKVMGVPQYSIATNFNFTSLKKRIAMMNKMRTARVHLIKFLFVLPFIAVLLLSFRNKISSHIRNGSISRDSFMRDTIPARPASPAKPAFPANVASMASVNNQVTVTLKDGTKEKYNLNRQEEKARFEKKYGALPEPPVPPEVNVNADIATPIPPQVNVNANVIAPTAPQVNISTDIIPPVPPAPPQVNVNANVIAPTAPQVNVNVDIIPPVSPTAPAAPDGPALPSNVSSIHINNNKATIKLKNGKIEHYDLGVPEEKERFKKKYGELSPTPPKPAIAPVAPVSVSSTTVVEPKFAIIFDMISPVGVTAIADPIDIRMSVGVIPVDGKTINKNVKIWP